MAERKVAPTTKSTSRRSRSTTTAPEVVVGELVQDDPAPRRAAQFIEASDEAVAIKPRSRGRRDGTSEQLDFFPITLVDASLKSDFATLEHPFFSLSKKKDTQIRHYEHNGNSVTITPSANGICTIWDKDLLLYAASALTDELNRGGRVSRTLRIRAYDFLRYAKRSTGKRSYDLLQAALERLAGTRIKTDITTGGTRKRHGFGMIDSWKIIERVDGQMAAIEMTLSEWFFDAILHSEVLTLNRDYFELTGGFERRLYEIARKHVGRQQHTFQITLANLFKKSGSTNTLREFRRAIKKIAADDPLPDYETNFNDAKSMVSFRLRPGTLLPPDKSAA